MLDPISINMLGKIRHQELLQEAETERRYRKIKGNSASLWQRSGYFLIAVGQALKAQAPSNTTAPSLEPK
jgi:hypothetical protein